MTIHQSQKPAVTLNSSHRARISKALAGDFSQTAGQVLHCIWGNTPFPLLRHVLAVGLRPAGRQRKASL